MGKNKKKVCEGGCEKKYNSRSLKIINGIICCHNCSLKQSKGIMPIVPKKIPKELIPRKRKKRVSKKKFDDAKPKIKPLKKRLIRTRKIHLYLTKEEKVILFRKFIAAEISPEGARERIERVNAKMNELAKKLREKSKEEQITELELNTKFLEGLEEYVREEMNQ